MLQKNRIQSKCISKYSETPKKKISYATLPNRNNINISQNKIHSMFLFFSKMPKWANWHWILCPWIVLEPSWSKSEVDFLIESFSLGWIAQILRLISATFNIPLSENNHRLWNVHFFGPESDNCLPLSLTNSLTHWLSDYPRKKTPFLFGIDQIMLSSALNARVCCAKNPKTLRPDRKISGFFYDSPDQSLNNYYPKNCPNKQFSAMLNWGYSNAVLYKYYISPGPPRVLLRATLILYGRSIRTDGGINSQKNSAQLI